MPISSEEDVKNARVAGDLFEGVASDLVNETNKLPCDRPKDEGRACVADIYGFWPAQKPKEVKQVLALCSSCRAHYYAQMARNALLEYARTR